MSEVQLVSKIARILDTIHEVELPTLKAISLAADLPVSTTSRLLGSMQQVGLIERNELTKVYGLGPLFLRLTASKRRRRDIAAILHPLLESLCEETGEDAALSALQGQIAVIIDRVEGHHALKIIDKLSKPELLYVGAFRKVLLSFQSDDWIHQYISATPFVRFTPQTITSGRRLWEEIRKIRSQGYATSFGERIPEAAGVAAAVFDHEGNIRAAVQIAGPLARIKGSTVQTFIRPVVETAEKATTALAGSWPFSTVSAR